MFVNEMGFVFAQIDELFSKLKKLIFIEQGVSEETKLYFIMKNMSEDSEESYFYNINGKKYSGELCHLLKNSDKEILKNEDLLTKHLDFSYIRGNEIEVSCICTLSCLKNNEGKMFFERTFSTFVDCIQKWCREVQKQNKSHNTEFCIVKMENPDELAMRILESVAEGIRRDIECLYFPFAMSTIISLSGQYYEKSECESNLVFLPYMDKKIDSGDLIYDFRSPGQKESSIIFIQENIRWIRKLLQMAQEKHGLCLVLQAGEEEKVYKVLGISKEKKISEILNEKKSVPWLHIKLKKHMYFDLYLGSTYIFTYQNGNYKIAAELHETDLEAKCKFIFGEDGRYSPVVRAIKKCREQTHGTILIVLKPDDAEVEVKRLAERKYGMKNAVPGDQFNFLNALNSIDGCMIMDTEGKIHGIGMILDGEADTDGSMARGARFNSSVKYIARLQRKSIPAMLVLVSEDGSVEIMYSGGRESNN